MSVELGGQIRRGLTVLKMRGSVHDKEIREFTIDGQGMHIGGPFREVTGILSGQFRPLATHDGQSPLGRGFPGMGHSG